MGDILLKCNGSPFVRLFVTYTNLLLRVLPYKHSMPAEGTLGVVLGDQHALPVLWQKIT